MPTSTVEDYIKRIYLEQQRFPGQHVPMGRLAESMGVVPGTATSMVKTLAESGLVEYASRVGTHLTPGGERLALHVLRRHRLVELFLVETLGMDWGEVHEEAESLEHAISDKVIERLDAFLNHPSVDPHGDPIPSAEGELPLRKLARLPDCTPGTKLRVRRIADQDPRFLRFVERNQLAPGAGLTLIEVAPEADAVTVANAGERNITLGLAAATKILVEPVAKDVSWSRATGTDTA